VAEPLAVTVRSVAGEKFERVIGHKLGPVPEASAVQSALDLADVPF
jgi:hypothetical protein